MNWFEAVASFVVIWWVVLFAVLPFGVRPLEKGDIGHAAGAPANPRLWVKAGITTLVAIVVWLGVFALVSSNLIQFRQP
jgi:predicted secreted protein